MGRLIIVCGPVGSGKTTYAIDLAQSLSGIRFSIDPWFHTLFSKDFKPMDFSWVVERADRCRLQIWEVATQILNNHGTVVLDIGLMSRAQRSDFINKANLIGLKPEVHFLDASHEIRKERVEQRNAQKDPKVYSFNVSEQQLIFMDKLYEAPLESELNSEEVLSKVVNHV